MKIALPIKPLSVNQAWQGRRFKTKECNQYCEDVLKLLPKAKKIEGWVEINYRFYLKNWKRTDGDNLIKTLQDCIVMAGYIDDDCKIMRYVIEKYPAKEDSIEFDIFPFRESGQAEGTI
jgi:Holliday junction resolvase RusA-like endonuclease